ncbi:MAG: type II toxin-antitoxin system Phd/YefM family antitoxin [Synergistaceae bacterium]|nr:type II toxin-antitoxin system Phd/YefM family antitoxin [Synergistaceae bacterium]
MFVIDTASDVSVQENFRDYCKSIENGGKALIITRIGKPEIVMMSIKDYNNITGETHRKSKKILAYEAMEEMKKRSPFPENYDYETEREEAFVEKYGHID